MEVKVRSHSRVVRLPEAGAGIGIGIGIGMERRQSAAGPSRANVPIGLDDLTMVRTTGTTNPTKEEIVSILAVTESRRGRATTIGNSQQIFGRSRHRLVCI